MDIGKMRIAIIGGGPSGLFIFKRLVESGKKDFIIDVFEKKTVMGPGMPYSRDGACDEHITNVSDNEIPDLVTSIQEWMQTLPQEILQRFNIDLLRFNQYKVLPRLLFGQYLAAQFELLQLKAKETGIISRLHTSVDVEDITDVPATHEVRIELAGKGTLQFDKVIICTGHRWPRKHEGSIKGYYDSPYPPDKLALETNHPVAVRGSSLTAIDAVRTLARNNGMFKTGNNGKLCFVKKEGCEEFKIIMHSRSGLLPALRFHLDNSHLSNSKMLTNEQISRHIEENEGFLSLDFVFEKDFKELFTDKDPVFYERIKNMRLESFVDDVMELRERIEPFQLLKAEYVEAEKSIRRKESIYWKEMLAVLSFAMNYPAKYFSAEDMQRLEKVLMPLISIVIAFVPQSSCIELLALNDAGVLDIVSVGDNSAIEVEPGGGIRYRFKDETGQAKAQYYQTFIDCIGQPHLSYEKFPFKSLLRNDIISPARLRFRSQEAGRQDMANGNKNVVRTGVEHFLMVPGITIDDHFQVVDQHGISNNRIFIMAVPYIGGFNPDYSGLDFCAEASTRIINKMLDTHPGSK